MSEAWKYPIESIGFKIADTVPELTVDQIDRLIVMLDEVRPVEEDDDEGGEWHAGYFAGEEFGREDGYARAIEDVKKLAPNPEPTIWIGGSANSVLRSLK